MEAYAQFWDGIAAKYARRPLPDPDSTHRKLDIVHGFSRSHHVMIDIGCGTGTIALELGPRVQRVVGIDISGEMLRIARHKAEAAAVGNVEFRRAPVPDGLADFELDSIDTILAFNILHLTPDWRDTLQRCFDLLKPGGHFVSSTPCLNDSWVPYRPLLTVMRWLGKAPPVDLLRASEIAAAMHEMGFAEIQQPDVSAPKLVGFIIAKKP